MIFRPAAACAFLATFAALFASGCGKKSATPEGTAVRLDAPNIETFARVHWVGKKTISSDTNAVDLARVWNLPASIKFQAEIVDKLAAAPWRLLQTATNPASSNLLGPLLQDLIDNECYFEIGRPENSTNDFPEIILAVRLDDQRAGVWQANSAVALSSLTGFPLTNSSPGHWILTNAHALNVIKLIRVGNWTVLGVGGEQNALLDAVLRRMSLWQVPFAAGMRNSWLETEIDFSRLTSIFPGIATSGTNLPNVFLAADGEAQSLHTHLEVTLPYPLHLHLPPWNIPTNLVDQPLLSFTALRGLLSCLGSFPAWTNLGNGSLPDQFYAWAAPGNPAQTWFAAPLADASNQVSRLTDFVLKRQSSWFITNRDLASFRRSQSFNGLEWAGAPYVNPFLQSISDGDGSFVYGGFTHPESPTNNTPLPQGLLASLDDTNLLYFSRENTDARVQQWLFVSQFIRLITNGRQLEQNSAGLAWLEALNGQIGESVTQVSHFEPNRFVLDRSSTLGLTAIELHLLVDWLESPDFPRGLYSIRSGKYAPEGGHDSTDGANAAGVQRTSR